MSSLVETPVVSRQHIRSRAATSQSTRLPDMRSRRLSCAPAAGQPCHGRAPNHGDPRDPRRLSRLPLHDEAGAPFECHTLNTTPTDNTQHQHYSRRPSSWCIRQEGGRRACSPVRSHALGAVRSSPFLATRLYRTLSSTPAAAPNAAPPSTELTSTGAPAAEGALSETRL